MTRPAYCCLVLAVIAFSCTKPAEDGPEAVRNLIDELIAADNAGDVDRIVNCYHSHAVLVPPGRPTIEGLAAIRENYNGIMSASVLKLRIEMDTIIVEGRTAYSHGWTKGSVISKLDSSAREVSDRYMMLLRKDSGRWSIARLMWGPFKPV